MDTREKLEIVLITYNRCMCLKSTFEQIFAIDSPIKDFDITILDNASNDGTDEIVREYQERFPNVKYIVNPKNIGGCPNTVKAFVDVAKKDYIWVLCDNDTYDWSCWKEIEKAIDEGYDAILTRETNKDFSGIFYTSTLVSGCIYKRSIIDESVIDNMYGFIKLLFPQLALIAKCLNDNKDIYVVTKDIVHSGINPEHDTTFVRGLEKSNLPDSRKNIFWSVGYFSSVELIKDRKKQIEIIENTRHYHKSLFDLFKSAMIKNKLFYNNYFYNFFQIYRMLSFKQRIKLIFAYLLVNLSLKDYKFYQMRSINDWKNYLERINEQKFINKLVKKLKNKKIILYGAGMTAEVLLSEYDLSGLNIIGIVDKRFERIDEKEFYNLKTFRPDELKNHDFDVILFSLKLYKKIAVFLKKQGINKKMLSIIKKSSKYPVRS